MQFFELGPRQYTHINISSVRITLDNRSDNEVSDIWVKHGGGMTMAEAEAQCFVAQYLKSTTSQLCVPLVFTLHSRGATLVT